MKKLLLILIASIGILPAMEKGRTSKQMTSSEIVEKLLKIKEKDLASEELLPGEKESSRFDSLKLYQELYPFYESRFDSVKKTWPFYEVVGSAINYAMNLDEITEAIKTKFRSMYQKGQIISREEFQKRDKNKWLDKGTNLSRIWGAEYLSKKFKDDNRTNMKVPEYIIVVDNLNKIQVGIQFGTCFPIVAAIENGAIFAEKIDGAPSARKGQDIVNYGYTDYSDPGNILKTKDNIYYVVDTEYKSFYDGMPDRHIFKNVKGGPLVMCEYFKNRFKLINNIDQQNKIIEFSVISK